MSKAKYTVLSNCRYSDAVKIVTRLKGLAMCPAGPTPPFAADTSGFTAAENQAFGLVGIKRRKKGEKVLLPPPA